jgi:XRE family transcriptional regulator
LYFSVIVDNIALGGKQMKKKEDIILGKRIKDIRIKLNYDQKRFAKEIGATVSALSNWENGRNKPNMEKLSNIAKTGDMTVEELLYGDVISSYFNEHWKNLIENEDISKEYYNINQEEFEYVKSEKEKVYNNFYKLTLEYGLNENNNDNFYLFSLSMSLLLSEYFTSKLDSIASRRTVVQTITKAIKQITFALSNAEKQTPNDDDKIFYYQLLQLTERYADHTDKIISNNKRNTL